MFGRKCRRSASFSFAALEYAALTGAYAPSATYKMKTG